MNDWQLEQEAYEIVRGGLQPPTNVEALSRVAVLVADAAAANVEVARSNDERGGRIACQAGCSWCCQMRVTLTVPEVARLTQRLHCNPRELEQLQGMVKAVDNLTHGLNDEERGALRVECPLLQDGKCTAYDARPLECRGYNSRDANACRLANQKYHDWDVPMFFAQYSIHKQMQAGILRALHCLGFRVEILELNAALSISLGKADVFDLWLEGEDIFRCAQIATDDPEWRAFVPWTSSDELRINSWAY